MYQLKHGDCRLLLVEMEPNSVDAVVTDPPYGLSKEPDMVEVLRHWLAGDDYTHSGGGFMGKSWDSFVPGPATWREVFRVLKPGGYALVFAGTRTQDLMTVALRLAGFEIRDSARYWYEDDEPMTPDEAKAAAQTGGGLAWGYGSGFPKSMDIGKAVDKSAGVEREVISERPAYGIGGNGCLNGHADGATAKVTAPHTEAAKQWDGWGTALKPAYEPIIIARKPLRSNDVDIVEAVEYIMAKGGFNGEIIWATSSAKNAAKQNQSTNSIKTRQQGMAETSVEHVNAKEIRGIEKSIENNYGRNTETTLAKTVKPCVGTPGSMTERSETLHCKNTEAPAPAAEKTGVNSLQSITSGEVALNTGEATAGRSQGGSNATGILQASGSYAGTAIQLSECTDTVLTIRILDKDWRIERVDGQFVWPKGLMKKLTGAPLTVADNVLTHGVGGLNIDGCRVATDDRLGGGMVSKGRPKVSEGWDRPWMHDPIVTEEKKISAASKVAKAEELGRWPANVLHDGCFDDEAFGRFFYCPKASKVDRNAGLDDLPTATAGEATGGRAEGSAGLSSPRAGAGRTSGAKNIHPTVKPTELMRYLCRLVTPPGGLVLDPFAGSGSTGRGALLEGFQFIGLELTDEYLPIAEARLQDAIGERDKKCGDGLQRSMFD